MNRTLDGALACWPLRVAADVSPYELGANATGDAPPAGDPPGAPPVLPAYVARTCDGALDEALAHESLIVLFGPARAGKTRTAYEGVKRCCEHAKLVVPEDADGLGTTLAHIDELVAGLDKPARSGDAALVLWLDELARFLPRFDLDTLDRLAAGRRRVVLVATVGEESLAALLDESARDPHPERHRARRLLARARAIHVPEPTAAELAQAAGGGGSVGSLRSHLASGWSATPVPAVAPLEVGGWFTPLVALVGAVALAFLVAGVIVGLIEGFPEPKSKADQLAGLKAGEDHCEQVHASPRDAAAIDDRTFVALRIDRRGCGGSDELRLYQLRYDKLRKIATLALPAKDPQRGFACIGAAADDPCAVTVETGARVLAGAFDDVRTYQSFPIALQPTGGADLHLVSLAPRPPARDRKVDRTALHDDRQPVTLHLDGGSHDDASACAPDERSCVTSHGAQAWTAISAKGDRPAVLVAGYLASGSAPAAPRLLYMRAWRIVSRAGTPALRQRCWVFTAGARAKHVAIVASGTTANADLAAAWRRLLRVPRSSVVC